MFLFSRGHEGLYEVSSHPRHPGFPRLRQCVRDASQSVGRDRGYGEQHHDPPTNQQQLVRTLSRSEYHQRHNTRNFSLTHLSLIILIAIIVLVKWGIQLG